MKTTTISALSALLLSGAQAVPAAGQHHHAPAHAHMHHRNKRDLIWETVFEVETVTVMKTVFADGTEPTGSAYAPTTIPAPVVPTSKPAPPPPAPSPKESSASPPPPPPPAYTPPSSSQAPPPAPTTLSTTISAYVPPPPAPTTTQAPAPTTTPATAPVPSSSYVAPAPAPSSSQAPAPSPSAPAGGSYGGGGSLPFSGDATYYDPGMGACGVTSGSGDMIVAIAHSLFDPQTPGGNPNNNPLCGKTVNIKGQDGSMIQAKVVDRCVGCAEHDLDMTDTLFYKVTPNGDGRVHGVEWGWA